jgi:hypothetical protein
MNEKSIFEALQKGVISAVAASNVPTTPVKFAGRIFNPPASQKWLEIVLISNNPTDFSWSNYENYRGIMRLILHWPIDDAGIYAPTDAISSIAGYFSKDRVLQLAGYSVKFPQNPKPNGFVELSEEKEMIFPATVEYVSQRIT